MKRLLVILTAIVLALLPITPAIATTYTIDSIEAYHHVIEQNDQLYLFKYTDSAPLDTLLFTLYNSSNVSTGNTTPYVYYTQGLAVVYFSANTSPTWQDAISVNMSGNFTSTTSSTISKWSTSASLTETSVELTVRILYLAGQLSTPFGTALTQTDTNGVVTLSASGQTYFANTFPNLRNVCPALFATIINQPVPQIRTSNNTSAVGNDQRLIGSPFDFTGLGLALGIGRQWATGLIWVIVWLALTTAIVWKTKATRISLYVFGFAMIGGAITGFMGMLTGIVVGLLGGLALVFALMWKNSY